MRAVGGLRRRAPLVVTVLAGAVLVAALTLASMPEDDDGDVPAFVERVSEAGAPGVLLLVRDGGSSRATVSGVADGGRGTTDPGG